MSIEKRFTAAVNVIRGLPKNGNNMFSLSEFKILLLFQNLINNLKSKIVFMNNKVKPDKYESVMLSILSLCYVIIPKYLVFVHKHESETVTNWFLLNS